MSEQIPFRGWKKIRGKQGGANSPGKFGGIYRNEAMNTMALYKQDTKHGRVRVAKVMGEGLTGNILNELYPLLGIDQNRYAKTSLVRAADAYKSADMPDETGDSTYIKSTYINHYLCDFWEYAHAQFVKQQMEDGKIRLDDTKELSRRIEKARIVVTKKMQFEKNPVMLANMQSDLQERLMLGRAEKILAGEDVAAKNNLINLLAAATVANMHRPSTVLNLTARKINSAALNTPTLIDEFAQIIAPRLFLSDFGVHAGNIGVTEIDGNKHLVALDFGAGFCRLHDKVNPYSRWKSGANNFLNHFIEYDTTVIASAAMAREFIKIGQLPQATIQTIAQQQIKELGKQYGVVPLKKFCQRIGMKSRYYNAINDKQQLLFAMTNYLERGLVARQQSLKEQGYALLLEQCVDPVTRQINQAKLNTYVTGNQLAKTLGFPPNPKVDEDLRKEFVDYALYKFRKADLVIHSSIIPFRERHFKEKIIAAVKSSNTPIFQARSRSTSLFERKRSSSPQVAAVVKHKKPL